MMHSVIHSSSTHLFGVQDMQAIYACGGSYEYMPEERGHDRDGSVQHIQALFSA